jgi:hypothetical protein
VAEWLRQGPAKPCTRVRFPPPPRAISSVGERYLDTVEATGSIPVSPTSTNGPLEHHHRGQEPVDSQRFAVGHRLVGAAGVELQRCSDLLGAHHTGEHVWRNAIVYAPWRRTFSGHEIEDRRRASGRYVTQLPARSGAPWSTLLPGVGPAGPHSLVVDDGRVPACQLIQEPAARRGNGTMCDGVLCRPRCGISNRFLAVDSFRSAPGE